MAPSPDDRFALLVGRSSTHGWLPEDDELEEDPAPTGAGDGPGVASNASAVITAHAVGWLIASTSRYGNPR